MVHYVKENNVLLGSKEIQDIIIIIVNSDRNINVSILEIVRGVKGGCQIMAGFKYNLQRKQWLVDKWIGFP